MYINLQLSQNIFTTFHKYIHFYEINNNKNKIIRNIAKLHALKITKIKEEISLFNTLTAKSLKLW